MGKVKDKDFKKTKIKIGKKKPSNNVTRFNIQTSKIVIPGQNKSKDKAKTPTIFASNSETYLNKKLHEYRSALIASINKKKQTKQKLDLTQSIWKSCYKPIWFTPWENIFEEYNNTIGSLELSFWEIINNSINQKNNSISSLAVQVLNMYNELFGESSNTFHTSKETVSLIKKLLTSTDKHKQSLGLDALSNLTKHSPFSFWYPARQRSAVYILNLLNKLLLTLDNQYLTLLSSEKFLDLSVNIISSVIDGRKSGYIIVGEDRWQIDDFENPPFSDVYYTSKEYIDIEQQSVTDLYDKWDPNDVTKVANFDLNAFLSKFSEDIIKLGLKMLPVSCNCEDSLSELRNVIKILNRLCMRADASPLWTQFVLRLVGQLPLEEQSHQTESTTQNDERFAALEYGDMAGMSNKERKRHKIKINLENQMRQACRGNGAEPNNSVKVVSLRDDINYYSIALVHQCLLSQKLPESSEEICSWLNRCRTLLQNREWSINDITFRWMRLAKQSIEVAYSINSTLSMGITDMLMTLSQTVFMRVHRDSKVKRLALATFVTGCLECQKAASHDASVTGPVINLDFWNELVAMVINERDDVTGCSKPHPTIENTKGQNHREVTAVRATYQLVQHQYPGVVQLFRATTPEIKAQLKTAFEKLQRDELHSLYVIPRTLEQFHNEGLLQKAPAVLLWDYFSYERILRYDAQPELLSPLCSSIDLFLCK